MTELKSNAEWRQWGRDDPLWAVAAWANKQKDGASPWAEDEFYALGESDWQDFLGHWRQYGINTHSCLEIGCGAGRITRQLARSFDYVYAVDVSEQMISRARRAVESTNVEFSVIDGLHLPQSDCSVNVIFSTHVLQHLDSVDVGLSYFREFFRVLDVNGTIMVHLPIYQFPHDPGKLGVMMSSFYSIYRRLDNIRSDAHRRLGAKIMRQTPYPIRSLHLFLADLGFKNIEFRIFPTKSNGDLHPFVFATKLASSVAPRSGPNLL
jgi:ubiquinone/menaquinone biosynthesis C-methylase UbiE